ncbi:MAG: DUF983 domain-containing protein [Maritimibacter sp.]
MWRGWRRRCPSCGTGPIMKGYLTVRDTCTVCGEELHHHRADDGPAYLLPRLKGGMVGFQWAKRMHGFARGEDMGEEEFVGGEG